MKNWLRMYLSLGLLVMLALSFGCSDDETPTGPAGTNDPPTGDAFDQSTAVVLAQANAASAASTVALAAGLAGGFGAPGPDREGETWNEAEMRWEWTETYSEGDMEQSYEYTLQYLDASGDPQMDPEGAASMRYTWTGTFSTMNSGTSIIYEYNFDIAWTGLGTATYVMDGTGWYSYSIVVEVQGQQITTDYVTSWETEAPGVSIPSGGAGCPTGSILYDMAPYSMTVTFDGTNMYGYAMEDASGNDVPLTPNEGVLNCTP